MRSHVTLICLALFLGVASGLAGEPSDAESKLPSAKDLLRQASQLAAEQDESQTYWTESLLLEIGDVQMRAKDFAGAQKSITASAYTIGRDYALVDLAEAVAREGQWQESLSILRELDSDHSPGQKRTRQDIVRLRWVEHLIETGDLEKSQQAAVQLDSNKYRSVAFRKLAVAYAKAGNKSKSSQDFQRALDAAVELKGYHRAEALWETAEAQRSVGATDAASATARRLVEAADKMDSSVKVTALREAAVLFARLKNRRTADSLFRQAIDMRNRIDAINKVGTIKRIAIAQARVSYIDDARQTAEMIPHSEADHGEALFAVAKAQLAAHDPDGAERTAHSITHYLQYRDDSFHAVVDYDIAKGNLKQALSAAEQVPNDSRRASAILKVAIAHAHAGDRKLAREVASRIKLTPNRIILAPDTGPFDFQIPQTWGVDYDIGDGTTSLSRLFAIQRAAEVARYAMTLAQALAFQPDSDYAKSFDDFNEEVVRALARAHAATGKPREAWAWAQRVGSDKKASDKDFKSIFAVERRVNALIGLAEGILDRSTNDKKPPKP